MNAPGHKILTKAQKSDKSSHFDKFVSILSLPWPFAYTVESRLSGQLRTATENSPINVKFIQKLINSLVLPKIYYDSFD